MGCVLNYCDVFGSNICSLSLFPSGTNYEFTKSWAQLLFKTFSYGNFKPAKIPKLYHPKEVWVMGFSDMSIFYTYSITKKSLL